MSVTHTISPLYYAILQSAHLYTLLNKTNNRIGQALFEDVIVAHYFPEADHDMRVRNAREIRRDPSGCAKIAGDEYVIDQRNIPGLNGQPIKVMEANTLLLLHRHETTRPTRDAYGLWMLTAEPGEIVVAPATTTAPPSTAPNRLALAAIYVLDDLTDEDMTFKQVAEMIESVFSIQPSEFIIDRLVNNDLLKRNRSKIILTGSGSALAKEMLEGREDTIRAAVKKFLRLEDEAAVTPKSDESPPDQPSALSDEIIAATVHEINILSEQASLELSLKLGKLIIGRFYGGDPNGWHTRGVHDNSFRKLAAHPDLLISRSSIYRAMAIYAMCIQLPRISTLKNLSISHYRVVLSLPPEIQEPILTKASEGTWTVNQLATTVSTIRAEQTDRSKGGRKPEPGFIKGIHVMYRLLQEPDQWFGDTDRADTLNDKQLRSSLATLDEMERRCRELREHLSLRAAK